MGSYYRAKRKKKDSKSVAKNEVTAAEMVEALSKHFDVEGIRSEEGFLDLHLGYGISLFVRWNCEEISEAPHEINFFQGSDKKRKRVATQVVVCSGEWGDWGWEALTWRSWNHNKIPADVLAEEAAKLHAGFLANLSSRVKTPKKRRKSKAA